MPAVLLILCLAGLPTSAMACLNDQVTARDETEFRSRYGLASYATVPPAWWPGPGTGLALVVITAVGGLVILERSERKQAREAARASNERRERDRARNAAR